MDVKSELRKYYESVNSDKVVSQHRGFNKTCDIGNSALLSRKVSNLNKLDFALQ